MEKWKVTIDLSNDPSLVHDLLLMDSIINERQQQEIVMSDFLEEQFTIRESDLEFVGKKGVAVFVFWQGIDLTEFIPYEVIERNLDKLNANE